MREAKELKVRKTRTVEISSRWFRAASIGYLLLPVIIFLVTYLKPYIGIPAALILLICFLASLGTGPVARAHDRRFGKVEGSDKPGSLTLPLGFVIFLAVMAVILTITSGIGEFVYSTDDHSFRRAIFRDLINYKWPVVFDNSTQSNEIIANYMGEGKVAFVYYFAYWMVPALIGKLFGFAVGNIALVLWSALGLFLILLGMNMFIGKKSLATVFVFMFASGLDAIPFMFHLFHGMPSWGWLEGWTHHLSYLSMATNLMNVYNQVIPCWLAAILLMTSGSNLMIGFIGALTFAYSPWVTIGILPIAAARLFMKSSERKVKSILGPLNVIPAVIMLIVFGSFYMAGSGEAMDRGFTWDFYGSIPRFAAAYILLIIIEILPYLLLTRRSDLKSPLLIASVVTLLIIPFYMVSLNNDLCMRASMPALFVLTVYMAACLADVDYKKIRNGNVHPRHLGAAIILVAMVYISAYYVYIGLAMTILGEFPEDEIGSLADIKDDKYAVVVHDQFYSYDYADTFFFEHLSRNGG